MVTISTASKPNPPPWAPKLFTRVGQAFRVLGRESGSIGIRWTEQPGNSRAVVLQEGDVPVQMRSIVLDVSRLTHGTYRLELLQGIPDGTAVVGQRKFVIR